MTNFLMFIGILLIGIVAGALIEKSILRLSTKTSAMDDDNRIHNMVKEFPAYFAVLTFHMEKSYDMIYNDRIMIYSMEATKPNIEIIKDLMRDFTKLTIKLLGTKMFEQLSYLYGGDSSLLLIMNEYFSTRFEGDEIRQTATNRLMDKETKEPSLTSVLNDLSKR